MQNGGMPDPEEQGRARIERHRDEDRRRQRATLFGLALCLLLVLGGLWLVYELRKMSSIQDCVMQGRGNCAPIDTSPR